MQIIITKYKTRGAIWQMILYNSEHDGSVLSCHEMICKSNNILSTDNQQYSPLSD